MSSVAQVEATAEAAAPGASTSIDALPYRPGPISRLGGWLEAWPWRGWLAIPLLVVAQLAWSHAVFWSTGRLPTGAFDRSTLVFMVYAPFGLGSFLVGRTIARRALDAFWPATGWPQSERPRWHFLLEQAPARLEWLALAFGLAISIGWLMSAPAEIVGSGAERVASTIAYAPLVLAGYGISSVLIAIGVRWLVLVARIHREATAVDVFDRGPIYAFSRLTVFLGLVMATAMYYTFVINGSAQADNVASVVFNAAALPFGIAAFVAPLWGIHLRLVREKEQLMLDVERRTTVLATEMYARIDAGAFDATKVVNDSLAGLGALRDRVARLPTWPWPPQLLRGFVSALLLPIIVFLATRAISGLL